MDIQAHIHEVWPKLHALAEPAFMEQNTARFVADFLRVLGYRVEEVPAVMYARTEGKSMHSGIIKPAIYMIRMMFCIFAVWMRVKLFNVDKESLNGYEQINRLQNNEI